MDAEAGLTTVSHKKRKTKKPTTLLEYKELLRVKLDAGYNLGVRRLLRTATAVFGTATAVFDSEDPSDREAVLYAFLNCVCRDANVTLVW
jgi:hypothetical protein